MVSGEELRTLMAVAFEKTSAGASGWLDPHPDGSMPADEEYTRVTNPARYRILAARTEAWLFALVEAGLAVVERDAVVVWTAEKLPDIARTERVSPMATGALDLVVGHSRLGDLEDVGIVIGAGNPTECITWVPFCGCDACDSGSEPELEQLDSHLWGIVSGTFRRLTKGDQMITLIDGVVRSTHGLDRRAARNIERIAAHPKGWHELSGRSWLEVAA